MLSRVGLVGFLGIVLTLALALVPGVAPRSLADGCWANVMDQNGDLVYVNTCLGGGGGGTPGGGGGGGSAPTCVLSGLADYCLGASACWANVPSALDASTWPEATRPSPESIYTYQSCNPDPTGTLTGWSWYTPSTITVAEAARQAYGALGAPSFTVGSNPPRFSLVGVRTWFWAVGPSSGEIVGSGALGLVAIGRPESLEVDPGDGSGVLTCPWTVAKGPGCTHSYERSSVGQPADASGLPAYPARMRLMYAIRFEQSGVGVAVPGLPATFASAWAATTVPVAEVQSVVGG